MTTIEERETEINKQEDKRIEKIMAEYQRKELQKQKRWNAMGVDSLLLELNRLLNLDDDMMDQDNLFDAQQVSFFLLFKRGLVDADGKLIKKKNANAKR